MILTKLAHKRHLNSTRTTVLHMCETKNNCTKNNIISFWTHHNIRGCSNALCKWAAFPRKVHGRGVQMSAFRKAWAEKFEMKGNWKKKEICWNCEKDIFARKELFASISTKVENTNLLFLQISLLQNWAFCDQENWWKETKYMQQQTNKQQTTNSNNPQPKAVKTTTNLQLCKRIHCKASLQSPKPSYTIFTKTHKMKFFCHIIKLTSCESVPCTLEISHGWGRKQRRCAAGCMSCWFCWVATCFRFSGGGWREVWVWSCLGGKVDDLREKCVWGKGENTHTKKWKAHNKHNLGQNNNNKKIEMSGTTIMRLSQSRA